MSEHNPDGPRQESREHGSGSRVLKDAPAALSPLPALSAEQPSGSDRQVSPRGSTAASGDSKEAAAPSSAAAAATLDERVEGNAPCGVEALRLLNCVAAPKYEQSRCVTLLMVLRKCCESKGVKSFALITEEGEASSSK